VTGRARLLPWVVVLTVTWVLLQGDLTVGNVVGGVVVGLVVMLAVPLAPAPRHHRLHPLGLARFVAFVLGNLVTSSIAVVITALAPTPARVRSGIVRVELPGATPLVATMVANAITLTPGTLTLTAETGDGGAVLHVHALGLGEVDAFRDEIADLHRRARAAATPVAPLPATPEEVS
jgi:multicomponent Na+:H+ antiporter subunit E